MELGFVGLGKMGMNMVERMRRDNHRVVAFDIDPDKLREVSTFGAVGVATLEDLAANLKPPRSVWVMVPAGEPTESTLGGLAAKLEAGDVLIDGGNTNYNDDPRRAAELKSRGIHYLDVGTSGGIWGLKDGYCLMVGGEREIYQRLEPVFTTLAPKGGYAYVGGHGAGHYVKMIHNGIEYGLMQAYAEGFDAMHRSPYSLDLVQIANLWGRGGVVRSWLLELIASALASDPTMSDVHGYVADSGEGRWIVQEAVDKGVPMPVTALALFARFRSQVEGGGAGTFGERLLAALRGEFGGHEVQKRRPE
jgi:6-phosphogluconate dehydrogenase